MKSKAILIILIIALVTLLGVYYFLGTDLLKQRHENQALASQITEKSGALSQIVKPSQNLDASLAEAEQNLADAISSIPTDLNSTRVINDILKLAEACQVKAIPLSTGPWTEENTGKGYHVFRISMSLSGSFLQVNDFLYRLENEEAKNIIVESLNVKRDNTLSGAVKASLKLAVYSRYTTTTQG